MRAWARAVASRGAALLLDWLAPSERIGLATGWVIIAAVGFLPQLGGPGYDAALVAGLVLPFTAAVCVSLGSVRRAAPVTKSLVHALHYGVVLALGAMVVTWLHGRRVGMCDPEEGFALYALGPGVGALMGAATGAVAAASVAKAGFGLRRTAAVVLALAGPILGILVSLGRFYTSPMVFAFDPYFGYFSGPLYDTVIASLWPLASYRLGSCATLIALLAFCFAVEGRNEYGLRAALWRRKNAAFIGVAAFVASAAISWNGAELGHFSTESSIQQALGRRLSAGRCDVVYSSAVLESDARRVGRECHTHLAQIERFFDVSGPERVKVLLFANDAEKGRLMGAARTYIAKPWRGEVYIQAAGYPHPVLGHELAHVVAGSFGRGPFKVAGLLGGFLPDPGRIEGVATAAAPDEGDALTLDEWAAAMRHLGLLPKLESLFRLSFFGHNAAQAYTAAGAFVRYLHAGFGPASVRRWYAGESLEAVTKLSLGELESRWHAALARISLSEAVLANARARFERPAFFARRCPRVIDRENADANAHLAASDLTGARAGFYEVLRLDPRDANARLGLATCAARSMDLQRAAQAFTKLSTASDLAPWARLAAQEARADVLLRQGQVAAALEGYDELAQKLVDEDRLRTLDVKRLAREGLRREAIVALLLGDELGPSWDVAAPKLGEWSASAPDDGLADYLVGRNLYGRGRYRDAALALDRALGRQLPEPRVLDEALRLRLVLACARLDVDAARWALERLRTRELSAARRQAVERLAERCSL